MEWDGTRNKLGMGACTHIEPGHPYAMQIHTQARKQAYTRNILNKRTLLPPHPKRQKKIAKQKQSHLMRSPSFLVDVVNGPALEKEEKKEGYLYLLLYNALCNWLCRRWFSCTVNQQWSHKINKWRCAINHGRDVQLDKSVKPKQCVYKRKVQDEWKNTQDQSQKAKESRVLSPLAFLPCFMQPMLHTLLFLCPALRWASESPSVEQARVLPHLFDHFILLDVSVGVGVVWCHRKVQKRTGDACKLHKRCLPFVEKGLVAFFVCSALWSRFGVLAKTEVGEEGGMVKGDWWSFN